MLVAGTGWCCVGCDRDEDRGIDRQPLPTPGRSGRVKSAYRVPCPVDRPPTVMPPPMS
jgi:hypothetical protein